MYNLYGYVYLDSEFLELFLGNATVVAAAAVLDDGSSSLSSIS